MKARLAGRAGEAMAADMLRGKKYRILASGYRSRFGEIDLIVCKGEVVAFVEVKLRKNDAFAKAYEHVTESKRRKIRDTALLWLSENPGEWICRFDIVEVYTQTGEVNHIEGAFE